MMSTRMSESRRWGWELLAVLLVWLALGLLVARADASVVDLVMIAVAYLVVGGELTRLLLRCAPGPLIRPERPRLTVAWWRVCAGLAVWFGLAGLEILLMVGLWAVGLVATAAVVGVHLLVGVGVLWLLLRVGDVRQ